MPEAHQKIVKEILEEAKKDPNVIAVNIMGSIKRGEEGPNSDVDIEIVTNSEEREFEYKVEYRYGTKIDFIKSSKGQIKHLVENYPFFCLVSKNKDLIYDPEGFMEKMFQEENEYLEKHPEVERFREKNLKEMKRRKELGLEKGSLRELFDEAERKFSKEGKVTRDFFRKD